MKLFLCGGGSGEQVKTAYQKFGKVIDKEKPILYIPLAMNENKLSSCEKWFKEEIKNFGATQFFMVKSSEELASLDFKQFSSIFIGGGNTFKLLNDLKKNGNDRKINDYLINGGIVFGGSAGAIIFGKTTKTCLQEDDKLNYNETEGFNLCGGCSILCHLKKKSFKRNRDFLKNLSKTEKIIFLPEEDVIEIGDKKIRFYGKKKFLYFSKGQYYYCTSANIKRMLKK